MRAEWSHDSCGYGSSQEKGGENDDEGEVGRGFSSVLEPSVPCGYGDEDDKHSQGSDSYYDENS